MVDGPPVSFKLPDAEEVSVFLVRLPDGRIVARTRAELAPVPAGGPLAPGQAPARESKT